MKTRVFPVLPVVLLLNLAVCLSTRAAVAYDRINVTSSPYLAIPNDNTSDTTQIMAAINQVLPTPTPGYAPTKSIYFPPGTYIFAGPMTLPANTSFRLYGDGPGVSKIIFTGPNAGINASNMGQNTLTVDGLTLAAQSYNCGTAIYAAFSESGGNFRTATIHNVEIIGEIRINPGGYWTKGIDLLNAQNSVIDKVDITGTHSFDPGVGTLTGIAWKQSGNNKTTGLQVTNLEVKFVQKALETSGWVEGVSLTGFELTFCGRQDDPVVDLVVNAPGGVQKPAFHLVNGHVQGFGASVRLTNLTGVKISKVQFLHNELAKPGSMVEVINCTDVVISQSTFVGNGLHGWLFPENGILLNNAQSVRIAGNTFDLMNADLTGSGGSGSCIVVQTNSSIVSIVDNLFRRVRDKISDPGVIAYKRGNN